MINAKNQVVDVPENVIALDDSEKPWRRQKMLNQLLSCAYDDIDPAKAKRLRECASQLIFKVSESGKKKLYGANFCRVRLCPVCTWRRSLKTFSQVSQIMKYLEGNYSYILLTLTVRNCEGMHLSKTLDKMARAWNQMLLNPRIKRMCKGYFKSIEITHNVNINSNWYNTFHPHYHVLIAVQPSYFKSRYYISHDDFRDIWRDILHLDYDPEVHVERIHGDTSKAVAEVAKYAVKPGDFVIPYDWDLTLETVELLDKALAKRRFCSYGGVMKEAHKKLELDDNDDGDLIHTDNDEAEEGTKDVVMCYVWNSGYNQYCFDE